MPIKQSRLITIANAALLTLRAIETIRKESHTLSTYISQGTMKPEDAFAFLNAFVNSDDGLFPPTEGFAPELQYTASTYTKIIHVVAEEIKHFTRNAERNARSAEYMRTMRNSEAPFRRQRKSQPHTIFESSTIIAPANQPSPVLSTTYSNPDPLQHTYTARDAQMTPEQEAEMRANMARDMQSTNPHFEIQTPPSQPPTDYSSELNPSTFRKPTWLRSELKPEDDVVDPINPDEPQIPPSGRGT